MLVFSVLLGMTSGIFVFLAIGELTGKFRNVRFAGSLTALICLAVGGCASVFHMGHPERAFHLLGNLGSGLSKELFAVALMGIVAIVYVVLARKDYPGASKAFGVIGGVLGLILSPVAGASYLIAARPAWNSFTLPLMYLGAGLALGFLLMAALVLLSEGKKAGVAGESGAAMAGVAGESGAAGAGTAGAGDAGREAGVADAGDAGGEAGVAGESGAPVQAEGAFALKLALAAVVIMAVTAIAYVIWIAAAPYQAASRSVARLLSGDLALAFWGGVVVVGVAAPVALAVLAYVKGSTAVSNSTASASAPAADAGIADAGSAANAGSGVDASSAADAGGGTAGVAASSSAKALASYLVAAFVCTAVGAVVLRVIMYAVGTSVEQFIYR